MRDESRRASMTDHHDLAQAETLQCAFHDLPPIKSI